MMNLDRNKNSRIATRVDRNGKFRTETVRRDSGLNVAASTDTKNNRTRVYLEWQARFSGPADIALDGHEARTLYLTLRRHYATLGTFPSE